MSFLFVKRLREILIILGGIFILSMTALRLRSGTESNTLAMSKDATQICLFKFFAMLIVDDIIDRGSIILWFGRPAKFALDRILFIEIVWANLLLIIFVNIFLMNSNNVIG